MVPNPRILRITTVPISLKLLLKGQLTFFQEQGFEILAVSAAGKEVDYLKENGIPHEAVPMTRTISLLQDLRCLWKLIRLISSFKPDIVHTHTPKAGLLGMIASWVCNVPIRLHTVAGLPLMETKGIKRNLLNITERITYSCATRVYPNSYGLYDFIHSTFRIPNTKVKIIGKGSSNGIDTDYFTRTNEVEISANAIRNQYAIQKDEIVFSFVGRLVQDKGLVELVKAFKQILNKQKAKLILVGVFEEELDPLPRDIMEFLKSSPHVILTGFQHDVRPFLVASHTFVFPSYREGFPNGVMQAACLEVPCIVSDINGCNELIHHKTSGRIVPVKNVEKLLEAMVETINDPIEARRMASEAHKFVVSHFKREFVWNALLEEYRSLLTEPR